MKHVRKIVPWLLLSALLPWAALASSHYGNYTLPTINTTNTQVINGGSSAGETHQVLQTFSVAQSFSPSSLSVYWTKVGSPAGTYSIRLCAYPNSTYLNPSSTAPCDAPASTLGTWSGSMSALPTFTAGVNPAATVLDTSGLTLYPSVPYVLVFSRSAHSSGVDNRLIETPSGYGDGSAYNQLGACTNPYWVATESSAGAPNCADTTKATFDVVFDFLAGAGASLTLHVRQNGPDVSFYGECATSEDLPAGWTLDSNLVSILTTDMTSATGTNVLRTAECRAGWYDSGTGTLLLWPASYEAVATQTGTPASYTASATFTVAASDVPNPTALLSNCPFSLSDALSSGAFTQALGCYLGTFAKNAVVIAPFSWYTQVETAAQDASATTTWSIGVPIPSLGWNDYSSSGLFSLDAAPRATVATASLYDSATATGAADVAASKFPILRTLAGMFLWLETGAWLAGMVYLFVVAL